MALGGGGGAGAGAIRAGRAFVELFANDTSFVRALRRSAAEFKKFAASIQAVGGKLVLGGTSVLGGITAAFLSTTHRIDELNRASAKLALPVDKLSAFAFAAETTGQSLEDLMGHWENLSERVARGVTETTGETADAFKSLRVDPAELIQKDAIDQLIALADGFKLVENRTKQLQIASALGSDQFQNLLPLFDLGSSGIRERMGRAGQLGAVVDPKQAEDVKALSLAWKEVRASVMAVVTAVAGSFLPTTDRIQGYAATIVQLAASLRQFLSENMGLVLGVAAGAAAAVAIGTAFIGVGTAISLAITAGGAFATVLGGIATVVTALGAALISPWGLAAAAIGTLIFKFTDFTSTVQGSFTVVVQWLKDGFNELLQTGTQTWQGIKDAFAAGDLQLAGQIAFTGLSLGWTQLAARMKSVWADFLVWLKSNTFRATDAIGDFWDGLTDRIATEFAQLAGEEGKGVVEQLKQMQKEEEKAKEGSRKARSSQLLAAAAAAKAADQAQIAALQAQLDELTEKARLAAAAASAARQVPRGITAPGAAAAISSGLSESLRGGLASQTLSRSFTFGDKVGNKIEDNTKATAAAVQSIDGKIKGGGIVFGA